MSSVHLLRGDDESLLGAAVSELVHRLVGTQDRGLVVEELDGDEYELAVLVDAAQTAPFLTERRVVLGRGLGRFSTDEVKPLVAYLSDPLPSTDLVLVAGGGRLAKSLVDAVKAAGGTIVDTDVSSNKKERGLWFDEQVAASGLRLDAGARALLADHLGEQSGRLASVLETVAAAFGPGDKIAAADLRPFLGDAGSVPPWDLTDAIDRGDTAVALSMLTRMVNAGERHPLQIMAILHSHYTRMLRLDGTGVRDEKRAAEILGVKSPFQARKAMEQLGKLGDDGLRRAFALLAQADGDLRGAKDWPGELVMEVLVARLSRLAPSRARSGR
jgi:DNA polymerase-3 subunit delta